MPNVLIVGAGTGLSASLARCFRKAGYSVSLAARNTVKLQELAHEIGAQLFTCDVSEKSDVHTLSSLGVYYFWLLTKITKSLARP